MQELIQKKLTSGVEVDLSESNILEDLKLNQAQNLAKKCIKQGNHGKARKIFQDILKKFPKNKKALIGIKALASKDVANTSDMREPPSHQLHGLVNLYNQGKYQEVLNRASQLQQKFFKSATLYNIIGASNKALGNLEKAIQAYKKALSINPYYADAYNNIGIALQRQGKREEAIEALNKALSINPNYPEAYLNLGKALKGVVFNKPNKVLQQLITAILDKQIVRPKDIAKAATSLLKLEPKLRRHLQLLDTELIETPLDVISDLFEFPLLLKLMNISPIPDLELEKLFTHLRLSITSSIFEIKRASPELLKFQSALALQCFTNEYIYNQTGKERKILKSLEANVKKTFNNNKQPSPQIILTLASYKALKEYDWCNLLMVTDEIKNVFNRQVDEPNKEEKLKQDIPLLEEITDSISSKVREQYEENPYPRWVNLGLPLKSMSISNLVDQIKLELYDEKIEEVERPDILIAGCGTGQQAIDTATRFKYSNVLAIDLSLSSLAYAKRKTDELNIENIKYMQADVMDTSKLIRNFDIIECVGVLHHMDNPMAGWQALTDCLKPGGLMRIGLYSEIARQHIVEIRHEISQTGVGSNKTEMKSFRDILLKSDKDHHRLVTTSEDFYCMSTLKDLLFHAKEHRFTIPQLKDILDNLDLKFCGFDTQQIVSHFMQTNKAQEDLYDLDKWQAYEECTPSSFGGMYQFWCQKIS